MDDFQQNKKIVSFSYSNGDRPFFGWLALTSFGLIIAVIYLFPGISQVNNIFLILFGIPVILIFVWIFSNQQIVTFDEVGIEIKDKYHPRISFRNTYANCKGFYSYSHYGRGPFYIVVVVFPGKEIAFGREPFRKQLVFKLREILIGKGVKNLNISDQPFPLIYSSDIDKNINKP